MAEPYTTEDEALDALLGKATTPLPPPGLADDIMAAIHREEALAAYNRPWYKRASTWACSSVAVLCLCVAVLPLLIPMEEPPTNSVAIDDTMVVDEVLNNIPDDELFNAIYAVSMAAYE